VSYLSFQVKHSLYDLCPNKNSGLNNENKEIYSEITYILGVM